MFLERTISLDNRTVYYMIYYIQRKVNKERAGYLLPFLSLHSFLTDDISLPKTLNDPGKRQSLALTLTFTLTLTDSVALTFLTDSGPTQKCYLRHKRPSSDLA